MFGTQFWLRTVLCSRSVRFCLCCSCSGQNQIYKDWYLSTSNSWYYVPVLSSTCFGSRSVRFGTFLTWGFLPQYVSYSFCDGYGHLSLWLSSWNLLLCIFYAFLSLCSSCFLCWERICEPAKITFWELIVKRGTRLFAYLKTRNAL